MRWRGIIVLANPGRFVYYRMFCFAGWPVEHWQHLPADVRETTQASRHRRDQWILSAAAACHPGALAVSCCLLSWSPSCQLLLAILEPQLSAAPRHSGALAVSCSSPSWSPSCQLLLAILEPSCQLWAAPRCPGALAVSCSSPSCSPAVSSQLLLVVLKP